MNSMCMKGIRNNSTSEIILPDCELEKDVLCSCVIYFLESNAREIELLNNKLNGLLPLGGFVSIPGRFASLLIDQAVPKNLQRHLANQNAISILHRSDCACLCSPLSQ